MSAFDQLKDISNNFEQHLRLVSTQLFTARAGEPFEEGITKRIQDLTLLNSKLRFIQAKAIAAAPQVRNQLQFDETIREYGEVASQKVLEQATVKSLTQSHAVKGLITAPDSSLDPDLLERKRKIIQSLIDYRQQETQLRELDVLYRERQRHLSATRAEWDRQLTRLPQAREGAGGGESEDVEKSGPMYKKLRAIVDKLEMMRWLTGRLVTSRGSCDWLADPKKTMLALRLARTPNTIEMFTDE